MAKYDTTNDIPSYLDLEGLALYDTKIKDYITSQIDSASSTIVSGAVPITREINGHALNQDVTLTKGDVELGQVVNTGDSAIPLENGATKFTTGGAYTLKLDIDSKVANVEYDTTNKKIVKTINGSTTDVVSVSTLKTDMQLNNVNNTSDMDKPISTLTQNALDLKANQSTTYTKSEVDTLLGGKESSSNLVSQFQATPDNTHYPSEKLVKDNLDTIYDDISSLTTGKLSKSETLVET